MSLPVVSNADTGTTATSPRTLQALFWVLIFLDCGSRHCLPAQLHSRIHSSVSKLSLIPGHLLQVRHHKQAQTKGCCVLGSESNLVSWLDAASKTSSSVVPQHNTAVAGELVGVDVQISNPMAISLSLTQLRAVYEHDSGVTGPVNEHLKVIPYLLCSHPHSCRTSMMFS